MGGTLILVLIVLVLIILGVGLYFIFSGNQSPEDFVKKKLSENIEDCNLFNDRFLMNGNTFNYQDSSGNQKQGHDYYNYLVIYNCGDYYVRFALSRISEEFLREDIILNEDTVESMWNGKTYYVPEGFEGVMFLGLSDFYNRVDISMYSFVEENPETGAGYEEKIELDFNNPVVKFVFDEFYVKF